MECNEIRGTQGNSAFAAGVKAMLHPSIKWK
jgi:hypothetical protein